MTQRTDHSTDTVVAQLRFHSAVREAVGWDGGHEDGVAPVVCVLTERGAAYDEAELRRYLAAALPQPHAPVDLLEVADIPRTSHGDVDQPALAAYAIATGLLALWRDAFAGDDVSLHDDFFGLGGYSLLAVRLLVRIADRYDVDLPLADFFDLPTVLDVARRLVELGASPSAAAVPPREEDELNLDDLLAQVEQLSEEEVLALLRQEEPADGGGTTPC